MIGEKLSDRYEIVSELGHGAMGVVYRAHDPRLDRDVAVKVIAPSHLNDERQQRFQMEAHVVAKMDHRSIVPVYDFGHHGGSLFYVMPVLDGVDLRQFRQEQPLVLGEMIDMAVDVAEALHYSHERGVVHRDIKPENIMLNRGADGRIQARVLDFGIARASDVSNVTKSGMIVGTVSYASPEQVSGEPSRWSLRHLLAGLRAVRVRRRQGAVQR